MEGHYFLAVRDVEADFFVAGFFATGAFLALAAASFLERSRTLFSSFTIRFSILAWARSASLAAFLRAVMSAVRRRRVSALVAKPSSLAEIFSKSGLHSVELNLTAKLCELLTGVLLSGLEASVDLLKRLVKHTLGLAQLRLHGAHGVFDSLLRLSLHGCPPCG
jgi:hypothetical protein